MNHDSVISNDTGMIAAIQGLNLDKKVKIEMFVKTDKLVWLRLTYYNETTYRE